MRVYKKDELAELAAVLARDGVISVPTDTVYGVCARAFSEQAQENLRQVKNRPADKAFPLMCGSIEEIREIAEVSDDAARIIRAYMPGPLTVVLKKKDSVPAFINGGMETVAVRLASSAEIEELIEIIGQPLYMTSANQSGQKTCTSIEEIKEACPLLDGILEGEPRFGKASTIADLTDGIRILRPGPLTEEDLYRALKTIDRADLERTLVREEFDAAPAYHDHPQMKAASLPPAAGSRPSMVEEAAHPYATAEKQGMRDWLRKKPESFAELLFRMIDSHGCTDVEVYKRAGLDRRYFSKIRGGAVPRKYTVAALALAMRLDHRETSQLLAKAGYAFSDISTKDRILEYCIRHDYFDLTGINELLYSYGETPLLD